MAESERERIDRINRESVKAAFTGKIKGTGTPAGDWGERPVRGKALDKAIDDGESNGGISGDRSGQKPKVTKKSQKKEKKGKK